MIKKTLQSPPYDDNAHTWVDVVFILSGLFLFVMALYLNGLADTYLLVNNIIN